MFQFELEKIALSWPFCQSISFKRNDCTVLDLAMAFWIPYHMDSLSPSSSFSSCWLQTLHLSIITPCASFNIERRGAKMAYCANYKGHKPFSPLHQRGNHPSSPEVNWTLNANHHDALCWSALSSHHLHRIQPRGSKTLPRRDWGQAAGEDRSLRGRLSLELYFLSPGTGEGGLDYRYIQSEK